MEKNELKEYGISSINNLHIYGRTDFTENGLLPLFWTASGIAVNCTAGELWAKIDGGYSVYEPWVSVWINGVRVSRFMIQKGVNWYCLFRGLPQGKINHFALMKETQAMSGDNLHKVVLHSLGVPASYSETAAEKVFAPLENKKLKLEFIGDSITTGEGLEGGVNEMDWITPWMSIGTNYALLTSKALDADFRIISQSGWGVTSGWDNDRNCSLPAFYEQRAGLLWGEENEKLGAKKLHDFSSWQPDFIIVNLGTNDWGAFNNPPKKDERTGEEWKLHLDENKKPVAADRNFFKTAVKDFLNKLHRNNPHAEIFWAYGMCCPELGDAIEEAVSEYAEASAVDVQFVKLPCMSDETEEEKGSRQHPGPGTHRRASEVLVKKILGK